MKEGLWALDMHTEGVAIVGCSAKSGGHGDHRCPVKDEMARIGSRTFLFAPGSASFLASCVTAAARRIIQGYFSSSDP